MGRGGGWGAQLKLRNPVLVYRPCLSCAACPAPCYVEDEGEVGRGAVGHHRAEVPAALHAQGGARKVGYEKAPVARFAAADLGQQAPQADHAAERLAEGASGWSGWWFGAGVVVVMPMKCLQQSACSAGPRMVCG